jgi:hypothetical protein
MAVDDLHWNDLDSMDPLEVTDRAQAQWDPQRGFCVPFLNDVYWVSMSMRTILPERPDVPLDAYLPLVLVHYLLGAQDRPLKGVMVTGRELPGGAFFFRHLHELPTQILEETFGRHPHSFLHAGRSLGGQVLGSTPHAIELRPLPRILLQFHLWQADEEFPAKCVITFDESIHTHLPLDVIWALTHLLADRLIAKGLVSEKKKSEVAK